MRVEAQTGKLNGCCVILAGGQSRRMGENKALMDFDGEPLIRRLARRVAPWFRQTVVVTNSPAEYAFLDLPMVGDRICGLGPLGGLEAGLGLCQFDHAFFVACDMPFIDERLVRYLFGLAPGHDVVVPQVAGDFEPLHAVYGKSCLPAVTRLLDERRLRLLNLFDGARVRLVGETEIRPFGDPAWLFFNCNTPADVQQAREWAAQPGRG